MDCFKKAARSAVTAATCSKDAGDVENTDQSGSRKSHKPLPKRPISSDGSGGACDREQFDLPYDPIDLDDSSSVEARGVEVVAAAGNPATQRQRDWWETLFPARFTVDSDDEDAEFIGADAGEDPLAPLRTLTQTSRRRPGEAAAAAGSSGGGNAYRRVWERMQREEAEAKARVAAAAAAAALRESANSSETSASQSRSRRRRSPKEVNGGGGDDCVWTPSELRLFRQELEKLRQENNQLKAAIRFQMERLECLETKCRVQGRQLQSKSGAASESARANERYRILAEGLQARALEAERHCEQLLSELSQTAEERDRVREEARATGERLQRAKAKLARMRDRESGSRDQLAREFALREEQQRCSQAEQLRQLEDALADLRSELRREQFLHCATRLGHQQLLAHFSSSSNGGGGTACSTCGGRASSIADADIRLF